LIFVIGISNLSRILGKLERPDGGPRHLIGVAVCAAENNKNRSAGRKPTGRLDGIKLHFMAVYSSSSKPQFSKEMAWLFLTGQTLSDVVESLYASWRLPPLAAMLSIATASCLWRTRKTTALMFSKPPLKQKQSRQTVISHMFIGSAAMRLAL
jgi:hypothetical protein